MITRLVYLLSLCTLVITTLWNKLLQDVRKFFYRKLSARTLDSLLTETLVARIPTVELEHHWVRTEDGNTIVMQRIRHVTNRSTGRVVMMQHGLLETSAAFVLHGEESISIKLATLGYDVWLGNNRSNIYGQIIQTEKNEDGEYEIKFSSRTNDPSFWQYSIDDLIRYDFPAMAKYVQETTKVEKIDFIGMSQGAAQATCSMIVQPELRNIFNHMVLLSPALRLKKTTNWLLRLFIQAPVKLLGSNEFFIPLHLAQLLIPSWLVGIGGPLVVLALGFMNHPFETDLTLSQKAQIFSGLPVGATGAKNMQQWFSMLRNGGPLRRIDGDAYELEDAFDSWSSTTEHTPKLLVVLGDEDVVIDHEATRQLFSKLNLETCKIMVEPKYGHIDFLWSGIESTKKIHNEIEQFLQVH